MALELTLESGETVQIIDNSGEARGQTFGKGDDAKLSAKKSLSRATEFAQEALETLRGVGDLDEIIVEIGLEAGAEGGFFGIAKAHSKATIVLKAKWVKP